MKAIKAMEAEGWELSQCQHDNGYVYQTFRKPIEKPMPKIMAGDYLVGQSSNIYVFEDDNPNKIRVGLVEIYRQGKLIWSKDEI